MVVQHNIPSLNAHRNLLVNNSATAKNLEKLSSGFRINRAGDDAAGLAISEKMRAQIRGLAMAEQNANNGISLIQTAEGGLNETHAILQRMRELAVQASNGTYQDEDRKQIALEVEALKSEINRIASATNYNKINLLDGTTGGKMIQEDFARPMANTATQTADMTIAQLNDLFNLTGTGAIGATDFKWGGSAADTMTLTIENGELTLTDGGGFSMLWEDVSKAITLNKFKLDATGTEFEIDTAVKTTLDTIAQWAVDNPEQKVTIDFAVTNTLAQVTAITSAEGTFTSKNTYAGDAGDLGNLLKGLDGTSTVTLTGAMGGEEVTFTTIDGQIFATWNDGTKDITVLGTLTGGNFLFDFDGTNKIQLDDGSWTAADIGENGSFTITIDSGAVSGDTVEIDTTGTSALAGANNDGKIGKVFAENPAAMAALGDVSDLVQALFDEIGLEIDDELSFTQDFIDSVLAGDSADAYIMTREDGNGSKELVLQVGDKGYVLNAQNEFVDTKTGEVVANLSKGYTATDSNGVIKFTIDAQGTTTELKDLQKGMIAATSSQVTFQIGANGSADQRVGLHVNNMSTFFIGDVEKGNYVADIDISTIEGANAAIDVVNEAIMQVSAQRAQLGALQNRLEHTVQNLSVTRENLTAAESTIRDVDMAKEMMEFTKNSILVQASQAMLAQANALPQGILSLLR